MGKTSKEFMGRAPDGAAPVDIGPETTVNEIIARVPAAGGVLARLGIDTCCGGALPLGEVTRRHGLDLDEILQSIEEAASDR